MPIQLVKKKHFQKKIDPEFLNNSIKRISLVIKFLISVCAQKKLLTFSECFCEEILLNTQEKSLTVQKNEV